MQENESPTTGFSRRTLEGGALAGVVGGLVIALFSGAVTVVRGENL